MKREEAKHNDTQEMKPEKQVPEREQEPGEQKKLMQEEYEKMAAQVQEFKDKWMRAAAELENAKKRWQKEKEEVLLFGNSQLISALLPVLDHFDKALEGVPEEKNEFQQGIELIYRELKNTLNKFGLEKITDLEGKDFDPFEQEAISYEEHEEIPEGKVIEVVRAGYRFQNRLLRPALVKVSKGKKKETSESGNSRNQQGGDKNGQGDRN